jgi:geranylgeranylglycerol-phosphate geranylgeranyltransferase
MNSKKLSPYIILIRPLNFLITFITVIIAAVICNKGSYSSFKVLLAALTASLTMSAGNVINDFFDINGDKINHPARPLPSGAVSPNAALIYYYILVSASVVISVFISDLNLIINLTAVILLYLYSVRLKQIVLLGNIVVASLTALAFIYGGIAVNNFYYSIIPALFAFIINLIREIVKDMEDSEGDLSEGISSFAATFGLKSAKNFIIALSILLIIFTALPYTNGNYSIYYISVILLLFIPVLIYFLFSLNKDDSQKNLNKLSFILKLDMVFGLIALYLGK